MRSSDIILGIVAIFFPPVSVAMLTGCSFDLLINIALTILGFIPGHIHAFYLLYLNAKAEEKYGKGGYRYHGNGEFLPIHGGYQPVPPPPSYGTTAGNH
ncbi:hypothetical protein T439DRAFT_380405 [Meredithblackwellia eburnea MCA 4105]